MWGWGICTYIEEKSKITDISVRKGEGVNQTLCDFIPFLLSNFSKTKLPSESESETFLPYILVLVHTLVKKIDT